MPLHHGAYAIPRFRHTEASQLAECVLGFEGKDFYKSMTTLHDSTLWQDVYHPKIEETPAYVKVQIVDDTTVVISFKSLEDQ
jgi:hypothetical protein